MDSTGLIGMASPYQTGLALLALLLSPWDFLTLLTPASTSLGQGVSLGAGRQRMRVLSAGSDIYGCSVY